MKLFGTMIINEENHLEIGGVDTLTLAKTYQTPLYVMDEALIRQNCQTFKQSFQHEKIATEVIYASKAFNTLAMCKLIAEEGLSIDVVSGGELYTALKAGFPAERIYFHGNNKEDDELLMAVEANIGRIVIDNWNEFHRLEEICKRLGKVMDAQLRINPGIEAHTHEFISTTKNDSKFGESIFSEDIYDIIKEMDASPYVNFKGIHSHIGSQIFEESSFINQVNVMFTFVKTIIQNTKASVEEVNLGGGFGIYYHEGDKPIDLEAFFSQLLQVIEETCDNLYIPYPKVMIEPGRSIVGNAGTTLYEVGSTKQTYGGKNYVFVNGSMADNIRTALYDATYEAALANRMTDENEVTYTVTGKCCESGDLIIKSIELPKAKRGDLMAVGSTGAYNYSMASNYNRLPRPAVVFVKDGESRVVVRRESYDDLIRNDVL